MRGGNRDSETSGPSLDLTAKIEEELRVHIEEEVGDGNSGGLWCELVCGWGVEMLSMWGTEWRGMGGLLEEVVAAWLNCGAVKVVVNLVTFCVAKEPQGAVAHVLSTAAQCSPILDWLVAHIGASHPSPVLGHLLDPSVQVSLEPEHLDRTTNILSHLSVQHNGAVGKALTGLFVKTVHGHCWPGAGPQLLLLLTRSGPLLETLSPSLPSLLTPATLNRMATQSASWVPTYFRSWNDVQQVCVQLLLDSASPSLLLLLLKGITPPLSPSDGELLPLVRSSMTTLLHRLLAELSSLAYSKRSVRPRVSLLLSLGGAEALISHALESNSPAVVRAVTQLLVMSCSQQLCPGLLAKLLRGYSPSPALLHMAARVSLAFVREQNVLDGGVLVAPLAEVVSKSGKGLSNAFATIELLSSGVSLRAPLSYAISSIVPTFAQLINVPEVGSSVVKLLSKISLTQPLSLSHTSCLAHAVTCHLMNALQLPDSSEKISVVGHCDRLLSQLSKSSCGQGLVTRLIVEAVFRQEWAHIFGATVTESVDSEEVASGVSSQPKQLLKANYDFDSWVKLPQSHTTIFHAGTISSNCHFITRPPLPKEEVILNTQLLLNTLTGVSKHHEQHAPLTIAFLLVEIISPDIMYNGFPWPDENIKFTIERDLTIKKTFEDYPIAWELLELVASNRPSLCFCSVLVRALTASYISLWSTSAISKSSDSPKQLKATERLLEVMVTGQFLPQNLQVLPQMIRELAPHEVVAVLQDVWNYMRDNTPSPNRLQDRSNQHADPRAFDVCRRMILFHVETLGHLLPCLLRPLSNSQQASS